MWGVGAEADITSDGEGGEAVPDVPDGVNHGILKTRARWSHVILNKWHMYQNAAPKMTKCQQQKSNLENIRDSTKSHKPTFVDE